MSGRYDAATAMPLRASLQAPPGCLSLLRTIRRWQPDGFEPQPNFAVRPSPLHLAEKLSKKLLRLRKTVTPFSGMLMCRHIKDAHEVVVEKQPVSDPNENACHIRDAPEVVVEKQSVSEPNDDACSETPKSSLSSPISSSSIDSLVIPPHKGFMAGSQMMASMLLLVLDDEGDSDASEELSEDDETFSGPRVSAWHQPEPDEFVNAQQEWRWLRHGAKSSTLVSQMVKNTETPDYVRYKYLATGASVPGTAAHRNTVTLLDCLWVRGELPHLLASVLEVFQFNAATAVERLKHDLLAPPTASSH